GVRVEWPATQDTCRAVGWSLSDGRGRRGWEAIFSGLTLTIKQRKLRESDLCADPAAAPFKVPEGRARSRVVAELDQCVAQQLIRISLLRIQLGQSKRVVARGGEFVICGLDLCKRRQTADIQLLRHCRKRSSGSTRGNVQVL